MPQQTYHVSLNSAAAAYVNSAILQDQSVDDVMNQAIALLAKKQRAYLDWVQREIIEKGENSGPGLRLDVRDPESVEKFWAEIDRGAQEKIDNGTIDYDSLALPPRR